MQTESHIETIMTVFEIHLFVRHAASFIIFIMHVASVARNIMKYYLYCKTIITVL